MGGRLGLAENRVVQHDRGIGREDHVTRRARSYCFRFRPGQPRDVGRGRFARQRRLVHVRGNDAERDAQHFEQLPAPRGARREDDGIHFSKSSVTGPSFTSSTSIIAPNSTATPLAAARSRSEVKNRSYKAAATSGGAASVKLGRRPLRASPYSVNWETTRTAPRTWARSRFILPSASPKSRKPRIFSAIQSRATSESVGANPASTRNPAPILPATRPSTRTSARETRWRTTLTRP